MEKEKTKKDWQINVRVDPDVYKQVKEYCDNNGIKLGWFYDAAAKKLLELYLSEKTTT